MNENNLNPTRLQDDAQVEESMIDFKKLWTLAVANWHWFLISIVACVLVAGVYLWFTPTTVSVTGKMEIIDKSKKGSGMSAGMAMLNSLPMGLGSALGGSLGGSLGIDAEKEVITSNSLVREVVKDLGLHTEYRHCKWGRKKLLYQDNPVNVSLDAAHLQWLDTELPLTFHQIILTITKDNDGYTVAITLKEDKDKTTLDDQTFAQLPAVIQTEAGTLTITENKLTDKQAKPFLNGYTLKVTITPPTEVADDFIKRLSAEPPSKKVTNILSLTLQDQNLVRGIDFVNHLVDAYNKRANDDKNEEAGKTDEFVNSRLAKIDAELGSSDAAWENTKKDFQITDPSVDAEEVMTKKSLYETKLVEIGTELQLHDYLSDYVHNPDNMYELIPIGVASGAGGDSKTAETSSSYSLIAQHNSLVNQRKELLRSMSEKAPQIQRLTESIKDLRPTLLTSMKRDRQNIIMKRNAVEREYSKYMGRVNTAPKQERVLTEIGRQREIKQGVYLLLLQKREETAMELANTTDKGRLIDETTFVKSSKKPQKKMVLLVALFLGALLPMGVLYLLQMFKTKIDTRDELEGISNLPVLGEIMLSNNDEAIRTLRTNLLLNLGEGHKVIMVASDADGDGKTYLAKRLTDSLTAIGKNALYMDLDMRNAAFQGFPADVLASDSFAEKMRAAKADNDYVVVDTPSLSLYNDAYQIAPFADATLYVVKAETTDKSSVESLAGNIRMPQPMLVLNGIDMTKKKYKYLYKK